MSPSRHAQSSPPPFSAPPPPLAVVYRLPSALIEDLAVPVESVRSPPPEAAAWFQELVPPSPPPPARYRLWDERGVTEVGETDSGAISRGLGCFGVGPVSVFGCSHLYQPEGRVLFSTSASFLSREIQDYLRDPAPEAALDPGFSWWAPDPTALRPVDIGPEVLHLDFVYGQVFGHLLVDMLPKIALARRLGLDDLPTPLALRTPAFATQMMALFGARERNFRYYNHRRRRIDCDRLYMPTRAMDGSHLHPWLGEALAECRDRVLRGGRGGGPKRIFLSRRSWEAERGLQSLANRDAVAALLADHGFQEIQIEDYHFADQVRLVADAEAVCAEDGSAPHSSLFARRGLPLILLRRPDRAPSFQAGIAALRDQRLDVVDGLPLPRRGLPRGDDRPYLLPLDRLRRLLQSDYPIVAPVAVPSSDGLAG